MCGITGYINSNKKQIKDTSSIISMLKAQKHRGPDDSGIIAFSLRSGLSDELEIDEPRSLNGNFEGVLGFNRLSILDLSLNGHQPMSSPDGKVFLTLNGEIYNAFDYKNELKDWGYSFKSKTDTEIVLALYLKYGIDEMLARLNGMFAIAIVDLRRNEFFLARDRFGIKPMYYVTTGDTFAFSSELKSFKYLDNFSFGLDIGQLDEYLLFRNNLKGSLFSNVQSLEPGHFLQYRHGKDIIKNRYFNLNDYSRTNTVLGDIGFYGDKLEGWLGESVKSQLMSDVKLGCQLSGGIDSSLVTWLANQSSSSGQFEAVSIIFNDQKYSEEKYVDRVKERLGIATHKFLMESDYYIDHIEKATWHLETPINHPNTIGIYKLSQRAKEHVTVLLSGEGADEVFGGYSRFYDLGFPFNSRKILREIKRNMTNPFGLVEYMNHENRAVMANAFMTSSMAKSIRPGFNRNEAIWDRISLYRSLSGSLFDRQVKYEMLSYLPDLLIRQDKMSMAHSIENRVPFLDNEVVENSFTIPEKYLLLRKSKEGYNTEKYLLKKMTANTFGNEFAFRDKMGFGIPLREYFSNGKFSEYLNDIVLPGIKERGIFNDRLLSGWIRNIGGINYSELEALWIIISFEIWAAIYIDSKYENWNT